MNYTKMALRGSTVILLTSLVAAALGYLARLVMVRNLSVEDVGLFYSVFSFLSILSIFKGIGVDTALMKFIPEFLSKKNRDYVKSSIVYAALIQLVNNTILIGGIYFFSSYLSTHYFHTEKATQLLLVMAAAFYVDSLTVILKYGFQGFQQMGLFSMMDVVRMCLILLIMIAGFTFNKTLMTPAVAYTIVPLLLIAAFGWIFINRTFPDFRKAAFVKDRKFLYSLIKYGSLLLSTSVGMIVLGHTDIMVLTYFSGLSAVALYSVALPTGKLLMYFPRAIGNAITPLSVELWTAGKKHLLKDGIDLLYRYSFMAIVPLVMILFSFSELILTILFGGAYVPASNALRTLSIGMIFATIYGINNHFFIATGKAGLNSKIVYTAAAFNLVSNIILVPKFGIEGAAITTSISYLIMMLLGLKHMRRLIEIKFPLAVWLKTTVSGLLLVALIFYLKGIFAWNVWIETAAILTVCGILYAALLLLLKALDIKEIKTLLNRIF